MTDEMLTDDMISKKLGMDIETGEVFDTLPKEIKKTINY